MNFTDTSEYTQERENTGSSTFLTFTALIETCSRCEHCGKSFSRSDHLKKHALSHHSNSHSNFDDNDNDADIMETVIDPTQLLEVRPARYFHRNNYFLFTF